MRSSIRKQIAMALAIAITLPVGVTPASADDHDDHGGGEHGGFHGGHDGGEHGGFHGGHDGFHGHGHSDFNLGFSLGGPLFWGRDPFYDPYYYRRPIYVEPPVYIEQRPPVYTQQPTTVWYYCQAPAGYYPYVQQCTQAWIPVDPRTAPPR